MKLLRNVSGKELIKIGTLSAILKEIDLHFGLSKKEILEKIF